MNCNTKAVEILHNVGIHMMGMFIADLDFTGKDFRSMYRWIKAHKLRHAAVSIFTPELDSPLYQQYADRILTEDPGDWDYLHVVAQPGRLSLRAYYFHYHVLLIRLFLKISQHRQQILRFWMQRTAILMEQKVKILLHRKCWEKF